MEWIDRERERERERERAFETTERYCHHFFFQISKTSFLTYREWALSFHQKIKCSGVFGFEMKYVAIKIWLSESTGIDPNIRDKFTVEIVPYAKVTCCVQKERKRHKSVRAELSAYKRERERERGEKVEKRRMDKWRRYVRKMENRVLCHTKIFDKTVSHCPVRFRRHSINVMLRCSQFTRSNSIRKHQDPPPFKKEKRNGDRRDGKRANERGSWDVRPRNQRRHVRDVVIKRFGYLEVRWVVGRADSKRASIKQKTVFFISLILSTISSYPPSVSPSSNASTPPRWFVVS